MGNPQPELSKWLLRLLGSLDEGGAPVAKFQLYHAVNGEASQLIDTFLIGEDEKRDADELAVEILGVARVDAETRGYTGERYQVLAFRQDNPNHESTKSFLLTQERAATISLGDSTDPPTEKGLLSSLMRHLERGQLIQSQVVESTQGRMMRDLERQSQEIQHLRNRDMENLRIQQELLDRRHERDLEAARAAASARRHEEIMGMALMAAPMLLSKFLGAGMPGTPVAAKAARDESIGKFFKTFSPEQVTKFLEMLNPAQQLAVMEIYNTYAAEDAAEQQKRPAMLRDAEPEKKTDGIEEEN